MRGLHVGVDIGGTFTDFALLRDGEVVLEKTLSTPHDHSEAVMSGLEKLAAREAVSLRELLGGVDAIVHATTVADNTLIQMNGALTGLLASQGFRDELELRDHLREGDDGPGREARRARQRSPGSPGGIVRRLRASPHCAS